MSKVTGVYDSLIKGVSEQVPHDRYPGQNWEQVNMVSDPIRGLARRRGSVFSSSRLLPSTTLSAATIADLKNFGEQSLYLGIFEYSYMFRKAQKVVGSTMPGMTVLNKSTGQLLGVNVPSDDPMIQQMLDNGFNSVTSVGSLILGAVRGRATTVVGNDEVNFGPAASAGVAWIKGGSYSRSYTLAIKVAATGTVLTAQYTTPASYYPGVLDTSDIPALTPGTTTPNPDYQKLVNDRVYAYQSAVNAWIGTAAAAIQPPAIAQKLLEEINGQIIATGESSVGRSRVSSTIVLTGVSSVSVDDGGDGSQAIGVGRMVKQASDLSTIHYPGKVVQIKPQSGSAESYYVKAVAKNPGSAGQFTDVTWEEAAGELITPTSVAAVGLIKDNAFYMASTPEKLQALTGIAVPTWAPSSSGDTKTQSVPAFLGFEINYMRMFQDRLIIVSGATVFMSRSGDYFNFFRQSALTIKDNDPIEVYALGSQDDVVTAGTLLDRNLILFGKQWQYAISGRDPITPTSAYAAVQSGYRDSNDCPPETSGSLIFFTQQRQGKLTVQQMQTGAYADTLTASEITQQLHSYLNGNPQQIVSVTSPSALFVRTDAEDHAFWVYSYLDSAGNDERLFDAWHKWTFHPTMGYILGMCAKDGDLYVSTVRQTNTSEVRIYTDIFTLNTDVPGCHLDGQQPFTPVDIPAGNPARSILQTVYNQSAGRYWMAGDSWLNSTALRNQVGLDQDPNLVIGYPFDSYVVLTNPYMRDRDGKAILDARLTLGNLNATLFESSALNVSIQDLVDADNTDFVPTLKWVARAANSWVLNTQQVADTATVVAGVYKEIRDCKVKLASRSWLPLTISSIEWQGQFFTRRRG
jgi:hypothetical protein